ncbi:MAG TPA: energy-coupling factor transporter transmembrane protein EcfT [Acidimicrobiales bacterium]|nr:energy-coupling factor transporter transmembrane protein EcfT [Acidimicrobiales bacterium]
MPGRRPPVSRPAAEPYRPPQVNLLRMVEVDSPIHRLWAGTKLLAVMGVSITLSYFPSWAAIGVVSALLALTTLAARIPAGAWPRPPRWFWLLLLVTGALASIAGGKPYVHIGGVVLGLGGIDAYSRFVIVGMVFLLAAAIVGWTTPLAEIAPAVSTLLGPLRLVRVPVEEAATAVALCVRSLPLLVGEMRTLVAARRLRPAPERPGRSDIERWLDELVDLMVAALAVSVRRAGELAEAITARGGTGMIAARRRRPGPGDAVALVVAAGVCYAAASFGV